MGFRTIYIKECEKISLENNNLKLTKMDLSNFLIPLDDIEMIFIEDPKCKITTRIITECVAKNVSIVLCNQNYLPSAIITRLYGSRNQVKFLYNQIEQLQSKKDKLWESILKQKIFNHISVVKNVMPDDNEFLSLLKNDYNLVKGGDKNYVEGVEARSYFRKIFGDNFLRSSEDGINVALNYGYSIINSEIIRTLVKCGLNPMIGIHHKNMENYYNLASDFIEPYRSFVDLFVYKNQSQIYLPLSIEIRSEMIKLLNSTVLINGSKYSLANSISIMIYSYIEYLDTGLIDCIKLPYFNE
jgi:CRISPR-associated protein Cas1